MIGSSEHENEHDGEVLKEKKGKRHVVAPDEVPQRRTNPKRTGKRDDDPMAGSSLNPLPKKPKRVGVARKPVKSQSLMKMQKPQYESLRWERNQYDLRKETECGPMFRTVIQQKIYEEVILALDTKIAPQKAIDFDHIRDNKEQFFNIYETCDRLGLVDIMKFQHDYNEEVVMQFYATFFLEKNDSRHFRWMTEDKEHRAPLSKFVEATGIKMADPDDTNFFRLHDDDFTRKPDELLSAIIRVAKFVVLCMGISKASCPSMTHCTRFFGGPCSQRRETPLTYVDMQKNSFGSSDK